jgi:hypothetical protein
MELEINSIPKSSNVWTSDIINRVQHIHNVSINSPFQYYLEKNKLNDLIVNIRRLQHWIIYTFLH